MIFKRVNYEVLRELKAKGFTLLVSEITVTDQTPIYVPLRVENAQGYIDHGSKSDGVGEAPKSKLMLIIDELLLKFDEKKVFGVIRFD